MSTANVNENRSIVAAPVELSAPAAPSIITRNGIQFEKYVITKKDHVITEIVVYRPVDEKIRKLFAKNAKLTAVNYREELKDRILKLNPADGNAINQRLSNVLTDDDKKKIKEAKAELGKKKSKQQKLLDKIAEKW